MRTRRQKTQTDECRIYRVLIVDSDWDSCVEVLRCAKANGLQADWVQHPRDISARQGLKPYHIVLVPAELLAHSDMKKRLPKQHDGDAFPQIIISRPVGVGGDVPTLPPGVHAWVEKPYDITVIEHRFLMVLRDLEMTQRFQEELTRLEESRNRLMGQKRGLQVLLQRLSEARKALSILMERMEMERQEAAESVRKKVSARLLPIIMKMTEDPQTAIAGAELKSMILCALQGLTDPTSIHAEMIARLSPTELRVAILVQQGVPSEILARHLGVSVTTLQAHRKNIRRKLGIRGRIYSLKNSLSGRRRSKRSLEAPHPDIP
ncbi:MAG: helix-turn-helix transcriptional regulator [Desulfosoma sp.]